MKKSSYEKIKEHIKEKLEKNNGTLPQGKILEEINNTKIIMNTIGLEMFAMVLSTDSIEMLEEKEWIMMHRELETAFDVQMESGILIQGDEQQKRDNIWWTSKSKQISENYYSNRYLKYMRKSLPFEVVKTIDVDTDKIMDNLEDPQLDEFSRYGMVVGHVQSGKTGNYSALICKAADAGYKFIVVIAGGMNNLRNQTQQRLNSSFVGEEWGAPVGVGKFAGRKKEKLPVSLTTSVKDFNKNDANSNSQSINFDNINSPIILVIKKNTNTLNNVIEWLESQYNKQKISNHAMLLIDDESDYASINTKDENNPTIINERIRKLLSLFKKSAYVAYTATPYANIFIDHKVDKDGLGKDLFPKDFIYALDAPSNYFGARKIFLDTGDKHIITIKVPEELKLDHKKDTEIINLPDSLKEAVRLFIINIGIRALRNQENKHNSMLIHASRFTRVHQNISSSVDQYVSILREEILAYGLLDNAESQSKNIYQMKATFGKQCRSIEFKWREVLHSITSMIETIVIREVHQSRSVELEYRDDRPTNAIVIGGTSLARGYTLEGLSVSYFLRTTIFYDTLMQMGRWFGYRENYEDLCRIYMTKEMRDNFRLIILATEDLFEDFKRMQDEKKTPEDFGLAVRRHPDSGLQVTARNKQKNSKEIYLEMKLDGSAKETSWIHRNIEIRKQNLEVIKETLEYLEKNWSANKITFEKSLKGKLEKGTDYLWKEVDKSIVIDFLNKFQVYGNEPFGLRARMPLEFIKKYVLDIDTLWDIAIYSGEGSKFSVTNSVNIMKETRSVEINEEYFELAGRQVSSGQSESIALPEEVRRELKSNRKAIRKMLERPLLMLHILQIDKVDSNMAAFGISFPGSIVSAREPVVLKINTVFIENLLKEEEYDD